MIDEGIRFIYYVNDVIKWNLNEYERVCFNNVIFCFCFVLIVNCFFFFIVILSDTFVNYYICLGHYSIYSAIVSTLRNVNCSDVFL